MKIVKYLGEIRRPRVRLENGEKSVDPLKVVRASFLEHKANNSWILNILIGKDVFPGFLKIGDMIKIGVCEDPRQIFIEKVDYGLQSVFGATKGVPPEKTRIFAIKATWDEKDFIPSEREKKIHVCRHSIEDGGLFVSLDVEDSINDSKDDNRVETIKEDFLEAKTIAFDVAEDVQMDGEETKEKESSGNLEFTPEPKGETSIFGSADTEGSYKDYIRGPREYRTIEGKSVMMQHLTAPDGKRVTVRVSELEGV